jgi:hypothetical protein
MMDWFSFVSATVGTVFVLAGVLKAISSESLGTYLSAIGLGRTASTIVQRSLPLIEVALGVLLLSGVFVLVVGVISLGLAVVFVVVQLAARARGVAVQCGCFGPLDTGIATMWSLSGAVAVVAATAVISVGAAARAASDSASAGLDVSSRASGLVAAVAAVLGVALLGQTARLRETKVPPSAAKHGAVRGGVQ